MRRYCQSVVCLSPVCCLSSVCYNRERVRDSMKQLFEVYIGLSESAIKFDLKWPWRNHFKVMKMKMTRSILMVAPRPRVSIDKNVHYCPIILTFDLDWPLKIAFIFLMVRDKYVVILWNAKNVTLDDLERDISRSQQWKSNGKLSEQSVRVMQMSKNCWGCFASQASSVKHLASLFYWNVVFWKCQRRTLGNKLVT